MWPQYTTGQTCVGPIPAHIHTQEIGAPPTDIRETTVANKTKAVIPSPAKGMTREKNVTPKLLRSREILCQNLIQQQVPLQDQDNKFTYASEDFVKQKYKGIRLMIVKNKAQVKVQEWVLSRYTWTLIDMDIQWWLWKLKSNNNSQTSAR